MSASTSLSLTTLVENFEKQDRAGRRDALPLIKDALHKVVPEGCVFGVHLRATRSSSTPSRRLGSSAVSLKPSSRLVSARRHTTRRHAIHLPTDQQEWLPVLYCVSASAGDSNARVAALSLEVLSDLVSRVGERALAFMVSQSCPNRSPRPGSACRAAGLKRRLTRSPKHKTTTERPLTKTLVPNRKSREESTSHLDEPSTQEGHTLAPTPHSQGNLSQGVVSGLANAKSDVRDRAFALVWFPTIKISSTN